MHGAGCEVCSAPRTFAGSVSLPSHALRRAGVHASSHSRAPLSGGDFIPLPPPSTLQDQLYPFLVLRESRSSPQRCPPAIFIHYLYRDAFEGILGRRLQIYCLLAALPEAVPC